MNIVRDLRRKAGIQQKELALEIGVSKPTVSDWEHGKKDPSGIIRTPSADSPCSATVPRKAPGRASA